MIEQIFGWERVRQIQRDAPLFDERERYLSHMLDLGVSKERVRSIASILLHVVRLIGLDRIRPVAVAEIEQASHLWMIDSQVHITRRAGPTSAESFAHTAIKWLRFHDAIAQTTPDSPFDVYLIEFLGFLVSEQLSVATIRSNKSSLFLFLDWARAYNSDLSSVRLLDVDEYFEIKRKAGWKPRTVASQCSILRRFFRYAAIRGWTSFRIAGGIRSPRVPRYDGAPKGPRWKDVRRLLAANSGMSPDETRTRAMLFLCSIYALRASEVMNLTVDDFDWFNETFIVRRAKQGRIQQFPLQFEVGDVILNYLKHGRPRCKCRSLFVTLKPPYHRLGPQTLRNTVVKQMTLLRINSERNGPHSLRHACATQLLRRGSSLRDIADLLGHTDMSSVLIYAKHDLRLLNQVADFSLAGVR